jgi:hypothetical protein
MGIVLYHVHIYVYVLCVLHAASVLDHGTEEGAICALGSSRRIKQMSHMK